MSDLALSLRAIDKRFGEVRALASASLDVRRGTLHAVLGENGAGKTTLMRIAFGLMRPDEGSIALDGVPVTLTSSRDAIARGLGMVHQHFTLVPAMTVAENIALGGRGLLHSREVAATVQALAERTGLSVDPSARVGQLGVGAQQRVEILKALHGAARILIMDEPTAVLTPKESDELFSWLRRYVAEGGTVVLVTHKLSEALAVADDVTVLRRGAHVLTAPASTLGVDTLVGAVTGDDTGTMEFVRRSRTTARGACVARLEAASVHDARGVLRVRAAHVECYAGEIIGLAGVEGSGVHELVRLLAGRLMPSSGLVLLPPVVGFIPEDRLRDAVIEPFTLSENLALRGAGARRGRLRWPAIAAQTEGVMLRHDVRASSPMTRAGALSGGNQQKFVVGRELDEHPPLVVAENPVRGLDIRATEHVLREVAASAAAGSAVVIYSADIDELLPVVDRMLVAFAGQVREVPVDRGAVAAALVGAQ
ncbi:MAG: ABC transporter ATP-binding protein [Gemmatimonadaceae bacterium]